MLLGVRLGLGFNPLVSLVAAPVIAVLAVRSPKRHSLLGVPGLLLLAAWVVGDGWRAGAFVAGVMDESGWSIATASTGSLVGALVWALVAFAVGYALPVWAGAFVGRRVTHGTGWASAAAIALLATGTLSTVLGGLS